MCLSLPASQRAVLEEISIARIRIPSFNCRLTQHHVCSVRLHGVYLGDRSVVRYHDGTRNPRHVGRPGQGLGMVTAAVSDLKDKCPTGYTENWISHIHITGMRIESKPSKTLIDMFNPAWNIFYYLYWWFPHLHNGDQLYCGVKPGVRIEEIHDHPKSFSRTAGDEPVQVRLKLTPTTFLRGSCRSLLQKLIVLTVRLYKVIHNFKQIYFVRICSYHFWLATRLLLET